MNWCSSLYISFVSVYFTTLELTTSATRVCPNDWKLIDEECYFIDDNYIPQFQAESKCNDPNVPVRWFVPSSFDDIAQVITAFQPETANVHLGTQIQMDYWVWAGGDMVNGNWCIGAPTFEALGTLVAKIDRNPICIAKESVGAVICKEVLFITLQSDNVIYHNLTDRQLETCIDHNELYGDRFQEAYTVNLSIITKLDGGLVTAHFNQDVNCTERSTMVTLQRENCGGRTVYFCPTKTTELSDTCEYECPCEDDGCIVTVFERRNATDAQPGLLCEITYGNSTTT